MLGTLFGGRIAGSQESCCSPPPSPLLLTAFALNHNPLAAHFIIFDGFFYFTLVTALVDHVAGGADDAHRGRVMGRPVDDLLGLVPQGALAAGPVIDQVGGTSRAAVRRLRWPWADHYREPGSESAGCNCCTRRSSLATRLPLHQRRLVGGQRTPTRPPPGRARSA
ncbi:MAG: hypothetical protein R2704_09610 [Microthrixaceae bacterium]